MKFVSPAITAKVGRQLLVAQKHSPAILFGAGVAGVVGTVVLACRGTLKLEEILIDAEKTTLNIKSMQHDKYNSSDRRQDLTYHYVRTGVRVVRLYAPAIVVGSLSVAALTGSHNILTRRNAGLTAAYAAIDETFKKYRSRVVADQGEDKDREYRFGSEQREVVVDTEKGSKVEVITTVPPGEFSGYEKFFDHFNVNWENNPELNLFFIKCQQTWANQRLQSRGWVLLNEVYKSLGIDETPAGCVVGWVLNKDGSGDNYIDFGVFDANNTQSIAFVNGHEKAVLLDFNVDGVIYQKI